MLLLLHRNSSLLFSIESLVHISLLWQRFVAFLFFFNVYAVVEQYIKSEIRISMGNDGTFFSFSRTDWITKWKAVFHRFYCMWLPCSMCTCTWVCVNGLCFLLRQMFIWLLAPLSSSCSTLFLSFDSNQYSYEEKRKHTRSHSQRKIFTLQMIYVMFSSSSLKTTAHFMYWHRSIIRFEHRKGTMEMKMIYCNWCTHMFLKVWSLLWIS